jgi:hypothetical protein
MNLQFEHFIAACIIIKDMIIGNLEDEDGGEFLDNLLEASSNINISKWLINIDEILVSEKWILCYLTDSPDVHGESKRRYRIPK